MTLKFQKGHGLGNDYIVIDSADLTFEITAERARTLCNRNTGIGSDGILLADLSDGISLRIINPDGSEAEKSGNGLRIFGAYLHRRGIVRMDAFNVRLPTDTVSMRIEEVLADGALMIKVDMGTAKFDAADVGYRPASADGQAPFALDLGNGRTADIVTVSIGNPHSVVFTDKLERSDFLERAPLICTHRDFANGTNVQFARVTDGKTVEAWIWERGAGETLASGSSASAVCAAAVRRGLLKPGAFDVKMQGGTAEIEVTKEFDVKLRGPAQMLFDGVVTESLMAMLL